MTPRLDRLPDSAWLARPPARGAGDRFVFLDKDGTLVEDVPYSADPETISLAPGAGEALAALAAAGFRLAVVSNQSGIARGRFAEADLEPYWRRLRAVAAAASGGVELEAFLYCPHHPEGVNEHAVACDCRKPAPGLLRRAAVELGADLAASWMVGDILDDVEAGRRAGCRTILVDRGHETEWRIGRRRTPDVIVPGLRQAATLIAASRPALRTGSAA